MSPGLSRFAEVAVPVSVHGTFTYAIPKALADAVRLGSRVEVEIGSKLTTGFVVGFRDEAPREGKLKPVRGLLDEDEAPLLPEIIQLCRWAAEYYIAPLGEMLRVALPANMGSRGRREALLVATDDLIEGARAKGQILDADLDVLRELGRRPVPLSTLFDELRVPRSTIERLRDAGLIVIRDRLQDVKGVRYDRFVVLESTPGGLSPKQKAAVELLERRSGEMSVRALEHLGISSAVLSALVKKGVVRIDRRPRRHTLDAFLAGLEAGGAGELRHSDQQTRAVERIKQSLGTFAPFLIEG